MILITEKNNMHVKNITERDNSNDITLKVLLWQINPTEISKLQLLFKYILLIIYLKKAARKQKR